MEIALAAIFGALGSIILSLIGVYGAKRAGLGVTQEKLISNLEGLVETLEKTSTEQARKIEDQNKKIAALTVRVDELKALTIEQADLIRKLLSRRKIVIQNNGSEDVSR